MSIHHSQLRVVIVGGGFAGFRVARALTRNGPRRTADGRAVHVTLVDRNEYFTYTPLLYDVASGTVAASHASTPFRTLLWDNALSLVQSTVNAVDIERRSLITDAGCIPYDRLVLAPGSVASLPPSQAQAHEPSRTNHRGLDRHTMPFMTLADATAIRERLRRHCLRLVGQPPTPGDLTFVIVGGGPKGVELIFDLADFLERHLLPEYGLARERLRLVLISKEANLMHEFVSAFSTAARTAMATRGIKLLTGRYVIGATDHQIHLEGGRVVDTQMVIWAAGIAPHPLLRDLGIPLVDRAIPVTDALQLPTHPEVYLAGDCARSDDGNGNRVPATASLAQQHGRFLARALTADLMGAPLPQFRYVSRGNAVRFGQGDGLAELGSGRTAIHVRGPAASAFRTAIDILEVPGFSQKRGTLGSFLRVPGL